MPSFTVTCDGGTATCSCNGACKGVAGYNATAMQTIVFGRGSKACGDATSSYSVGMCDIFDRITPANVRIVYTQPAAPAGLGYVGRPGGPVPTIKVSLQNIGRERYSRRQIGRRKLPTQIGVDEHSCHNGYNPLRHIKDHLDRLIPASKFAQQSGNTRDQAAPETSEQEPGSNMHYE